MKKKTLSLCVAVFILLSMAIMPVKAREEETVSATQGTKIEYAKNRQIKFGQTYYSFDDILNIYINGSLYMSVTPETENVDTILSKVIDASFENIKIARKDTNSYYNQIYADAYEIGQVTSVSFKNSTVTVKFVPSSSNISQYKQIVIQEADIANGNINVDVSLDGSPISLLDIQSDDIIAIKTNISPSAMSIDTANNSDVTILVSRETTTGRLTYISYEDKELGFGDTSYNAINEDIFRSFKLAMIYKDVWLDPFGRIFGFRAEIDTTPYAIFVKLDGAEVTLFCYDGVKRTYTADNPYMFEGIPHLENSDGVTGNDILDCVVTYVAKNGQHKIISMESKPLNSNNSTTIGAVTDPVNYNEPLSRLGDAPVDEFTHFIDTSLAQRPYKEGDYKWFHAVNYSNLHSNEEYAGAAYGGNSTYGLRYSFVVFNYNSTSNGEIFMLASGQKEARRYNQILELEESPISISGIMYAPIATIGGLLKLTIEYDVDTDNISITNGSKTLNFTAVTGVGHNCCIINEHMYANANFLVNEFLDPDCEIVENNELSIIVRKRDKTQNTILGDVNGDEKVNAKDLTFFSRYLAHWTGYETIAELAADVNNDSKINTKDSTVLARHIAKWSGYEVLPVSK